MTSGSTSTANLPSAGLCPGYRHVEEFGPDEDYEDEVEEFYVTLDLGAAEPTLMPSSSTYRLIGLDTPTPFIQLSGTVLKGRYESLLGTELLFAETKDAQDRGKRRLSFTSTTEQRICFKEVQLRPKVPPGAEDQITVINNQSQEQQEGLNNANASSSRMVEKDNETAPHRRKSTRSLNESPSTGGSGKVTRKRKPTKKDKGKAKEVMEDGQGGDNVDRETNIDIDTGP